MQKILYLLAIAAPAFAFPSFNKDNNLDQHMNVARNVLERKANKGKSPAQIISAARTNCGTTDSLIEQSLSTHTD